MTQIIISYFTQNNTMVYGRILYNNIKEYTPKWYPTIPYSQTVKPTFSILYLYSQKEHLKPYLVLMPIQVLNLDGDYSLKSSKPTPGCGKYSFLVLPFSCISLSTLHMSLCTKLTTLIEHIKQQWLKKELIRKNLKNLKNLKHQANDLKYTFMRFLFFRIPLYLNCVCIYKWKNHQISYINLTSFKSQQHVWPKLLPPFFPSF